METSTPSQPVTYIYALTDPRETEDVKAIRYIGKTKNPDRRFRDHSALARRGKRTHCYNWIRELLALGILPRHKILSVVSDSDAYAAEQELIAKFKLLGAPLTNLADGGPGTLGCYPSEETRHKLSISHMGNKNCLGHCHSVSDETRAKMSAAQLGKKLSVEHRMKISASQMGRKGGFKGHRHSEEARAKISATGMGNKNALGNKNHLGYHHSEEARAKMSGAHIGKKLSVETRAKLMGNQNHLGHRHSEEAKLKMSIARRAYWAAKKAGVFS